jgi:hypothetical protein
MKTIMALAVGLALSVGAVGTGLAAETSVTGHLRDSFCFLTMGAHGPSHQKCAMACAKKGIPVLLVEDKTDKSYVLMPAKNGESLPDSVIDKMEDEVTVTGDEFAKGGVTFLTVKSVK